MMYNWSQFATGSSLPQGGWFLPMMPMMGGYQAGAGASCPMATGGWVGTVLAIASLLYLLTWVLLMVVLIAAARYFWKKASSK